MSKSSEKSKDSNLGQKVSSSLQESRDAGAHQLQERREQILETSQELFLLVGLEQTTMRDIASSAGITPVTLYRYFPDLHTIAIEVAAKMIKRIRLVSTGMDTSIQEQKPSEIQDFEHLCMGMIDQFEELKDAYRYIGLFDHLYSRSYPSESLSTRYKNDLTVEIGPWLLNQNLEERAFRTTVLNMIMSFLEKMAARGDLMGHEQEVSVEQQLGVFKRSIQHILKGAN